MFNLACFTFSSNRLPSSATSHRRPRCPCRRINLPSCYCIHSPSPTTRVRNGLLFYRRWYNYILHSLAIFQAPPLSVVFFCPCDKVYHKQEVHILLSLLGQIVTWQYNPNLLNWPSTVINDHDWQLRICPLGLKPPFYVTNNNINSLVFY